MFKPDKHDTIDDLYEERDRLRAEIARLRAALDPFARHAHCTDQIQPSSLALWCAMALNALSGDTPNERASLTTPQEKP